MSLHVSTGSGGEVQDFYTRRRLTSVRNRKVFLQECLEEMVLPRCTPAQLMSKTHPFPDSARSYLQESIEACDDEAETLVSSLRGDHLPDRLVQTLRQEDEAQKATHRRRLQEAIDVSRWSQVVRDDLITNLSHSPLSATQRQALSLGYKFDTGIANRDLADFVQANYRRNTSALERGFIQGVATCAVASANDRPRAIPRRFTKALKDLAKDVSVVVVPADKGGGVVVLDKIDYVSKMNDILKDDSTYRRVAKGNAERRSVEFNRKARKILSRSEEGKRLFYLLEETPRSPQARATIKEHKPEKSARPITDGTGSAPHRLSKKLAVPLSSGLGRVSGCHLRNTSDLISKIGQVSTRLKKLVSFDVKSLFTNVPISEAVVATTRAVDELDEDLLPLPKADYLELIELCVRFGPFEFDNQEWEQVEGLAMGNPLSAVMAQLFMEALEKDHLLRLVGPNSLWFRYVDDVLAILPVRTDVQALLRDLNSVHPKIQFTVEEEVDGRLPFLDTLIHKSTGNILFSVYRKPTNKDDFIHWFSAHSRKVKEAAVVGFYLRALRVCSPQFLEAEVQYIVQAFQRLCYPKGVLLRLRRRAEAIRSRPRVDTVDKPTRVVLPQSSLTDKLQRFVGHSISIATSSGTKIGDLVKNKRPPHLRPHSDVYSVPCGSCDRQYIGETSRGFVKQRRGEHRYALTRHDSSNAFVVHRDKEGHLPRWTDAKIVKNGLPRLQRKILESALIITRPNFNLSPGSHELSKVIASKLAEVS